MASLNTEELFRKYFNGIASEAEKEAFMEWISHDEHIDELRQLMDRMWDEFDDKEKLFNTAQSNDILKQVLQKDVAFLQRRTRLSGQARMKWWKAAAAVFIGIITVTGGYLWYHYRPSAISPPIAEKAVQDVAPGGNKAILRLSSGETIALDSAQNGTLARQGNISVVKLKSGQIAYKAQQAGNRKSQATSYNTLTVPLGGQYNITLPDGSKVWMNAASTLKFPTTFSVHERKVELTGEAYFEIVKDNNRPFYVNVPFHQHNAHNITIQVLGTNFNINAYDDAPSIKTTLLDGAVKVVKGKESKLLKPGQQADINRDNHQMKIIKADLESVVAWKNGLFNFTDEGMAEIMQKISRWYNIEVVYQGKIPDGHYTGIISRDTNLSQVLKMLEFSGVHFKVEGKKLIVM
jgi:ferric-dicitrate binding protein FerR (iron transport regulator)